MECDQVPSCSSTVPALVPAPAPVPRFLQQLYESQQERARSSRQLARTRSTSADSQQSSYSSHHHHHSKAAAPSRHRTHAASSPSHHHHHPLQAPTAKQHQLRHPLDNTRSGSLPPVPPPALSYSSSSASSELAANDVLPQAQAAAASYTSSINGHGHGHGPSSRMPSTANSLSSNSTFGYYSDVESFGYSSEESRSTSPASKSAFPSPAFPVSFSGSYGFGGHHPVSSAGWYQHSPSLPFPFSPGGFASGSSTLTTTTTSRSSSVTSTHDSQFQQHLATSPSSFTFSNTAALQPLALPPASIDPFSARTLTPSIAQKHASLLLGTDPDSQTTTSTDEDVLTPSPGGAAADLTSAGTNGDGDDLGLLTPPDNFAMVYPGVYRSSFPSKKHYAFLKNLGLKTVLTLVQDEYPESNLNFFAEQGVKFLQIGIPGNKEPFVSIPDEKIRKALAIVLDKRNHPILIHCNKGKHRTGCLVGCLRKMQCWSSTAIFEEYRQFSFPKSRAMDQLFIELFQPDWECVENDHLPDWCLGEDGGGSPGLLSPVKVKR